MSVLTGEGAPRALQIAARERMKARLLADISMDLTVCQLEGWPHREYVHDLHDMIAHFDPCPGRTA